MSSSEKLQQLINSGVDFKIYRDGENIEFEATNKNGETWRIHTTCADSAELCIQGILMRVKNV